MNLIDLLTEVARDGVQINIWAVPAGFQANVKRKQDIGWAVAIHRDAAVALREALKQRTLQKQGSDFEDLFG